MVAYRVSLLIRSSCLAILKSTLSLRCQCHFKCPQCSEGFGQSTYKSYAHMLVEMKERESERDDTFVSIVPKETSIYIICLRHRSRSMMRAAFALVQTTQHGSRRCKNVFYLCTRVSLFEVRTQRVYVHIRVICIFDGAFATKQWKTEKETETLFVVERGRKRLVA